MVTNFLNFARPTQLSLATHDLAAVVERAADDLRHDVQQLGGAILVTGQFGRVDADDVLLRQAFSNLLRNAIEACQPTGVVPHVRVEGSLEAGQARGQRARQRAWCRSPDARDRIFQPFFTTKKTGTGLGLALVQKIIVTHNGRVTRGQLPVGRRLLSGDVAARVIFRPSADRRNCHSSRSSADRAITPPNPIKSRPTSSVAAARR